MINSITFFTRKDHCQSNLKYSIFNLDLMANDLSAVEQYFKIEIVQATILKEPIFVLTLAIFSFATTVYI